MLRKLLFIVNPISGRGPKGSLKELIEKTMRAESFSFGIYPSVASGDYSFLIPIIRVEGYTDIIIAGGDGTINAAVNGLKELRLPFGIIPCGSGNGLAFSAGIPKNPELALQKIIRGKSEVTDAFTINGKFACMLCGLGFDAQVAHDFANDPKRGLGTYIRKTLRNFISSTAYPFVLKLGEKEIKTDAFFISIANSNQFGNHFTIAPKASLSDGLLDIVVMTRQNKLSMVLRAFMQVSGYHQLQSAEALNERSSVIYFQTPSIQIINTGNAPLHIDGDPSESMDRLDVSILPNCFSLIR